MEYKFYKQTISKTTFTEVDSDINVLNRFGDSEWTSDKVQEIIEGVKSTDNTEKEYRWANEDVMFVSHPTEGVIFWDLLSMRGQGSGKTQSESLVLSHSNFIKFLEDFKEFIEKESGK